MCTHKYVHIHVKVRIDTSKRICMCTISIMCIKMCIDRPPRPELSSWGSIIPAPPIRPWVYESVSQSVSQFYSLGSMSRDGSCRHWPELYISALPTACLLRGYRRASTRNARAFQRYVAHAKAHAYTHVHTHVGADPRVLKLWLHKTLPVRCWPCVHRRQPPQEMVLPCHGQSLRRRYTKHHLSRKTLVCGCVCVQVPC